MEKIIELDLLHSDSFFEMYNRKKVSRELINYLISEGYNINKKEKIKIVINDSMVGNIDCVKLIKEGLKNEYDICYKKHQIITLKQMLYFIVGVIVLFISTVIHEKIFSEVILIIGWVLIWTMAELEIFNDVDSMKKRKILKRLLNSEFVENNIQ